MVRLLSCSVANRSLVIGHLSPVKSTNDKGQMTKLAMPPGWPRHFNNQAIEHSHATILTIEQSNL